MTTRREFLSAGLALPLLGARPRRGWPLLPRVNGGINVQPLRRMDSVSDFSPPLVVPELVRLQMRAVYDLGFRRMRITLSFNEFGPDFFGAIPYVRVARALGIDVLAVIDQFGSGFDLLRALADPLRRPRVLQAYYDVHARTVPVASRRLRAPGGIAFQVLNEPTEARSLDPTDYVVRFLAPARRDLAAIDGGLEVLGAATVGRRAGLWRLREMLVAGLESVCDRVALHVYQPELIADLAALVRAPVSVTETAARGRAQHLAWVQEVYPAIAAAFPELDEIYWFDLFDFTPELFRLIAIDQGPGAVTASVESTALWDHWRARVDAARSSSRHATFDELIPDMAPFLPTGEDFAIAAAAR